MIFFLFKDFTWALLGKEKRNLGRGLEKVAYFKKNPPASPFEAKSARQFLPISLIGFIGE